MNYEYHCVFSLLIGLFITPFKACKQKILKHSTQRKCIQVIVSVEYMHYICICIGFLNNQTNTSANVWMNSLFVCFFTIEIRKHTYTHTLLTSITKPLIWFNLFWVPDHSHSSSRCLLSSWRENIILVLLGATCESQSNSSACLLSSILIGRMFASQSSMCLFDLPAFMRSGLQPVM